MAIAAPARVGMPVHRASLYACAASICAVNACWNAIRIQAAEGWPTLLASAGGISAAIWLAIYAMGEIAWRDTSGERADVMDRTILAAMIVAALIPTPFASAIALLGGGVLLLVRRRSPADRRIAIIMLALTGPLIWGKLLLQVLAPRLLLALDAGLVGLFLGDASGGNSLPFADGSRFIVAPGCSSLHNVSQAILMWIVAVQLFERRLTGQILAAGIVAIVAMIAVNAARLVTISRFPENFDTLHTGEGALLFGWASLLLSGAAIAWGVGARPRA